jgi:hypothetical protein
MEYSDFGYGNAQFPVKFASSPFWMDDYLEENDFTNTDISYLQIKLEHLPIGTESILRQVTQSYIESDIDMEKQGLGMTEVLETIDLEYKFAQVPFIIENESGFIEEDNAIITSKIIISKILSFAALYRIPVEVTVILFGNYINDGGMHIKTKEYISKFLDMFHEHGWNCVTFPNGLALRIKRDLIVSRRRRFNPVPRNTIFTRSKDILNAKDAIREAGMIKPPQKLIPKHLALDEINKITNELNFQSELSQSSHIKEILTFFPNQNKALKRAIRATLLRKRSSLGSMGRAGFISYVVLSFVWYSSSILWQWCQFTAETQNVYLVPAKVDAVKRSLAKFSEIFVTTYFKPQMALTKFHRLGLAILLTPLGNKALRWTQEKLKIDADGAVGVLSSIFIMLSIMFWSFLILGDITFSRASMRTFVM